MHHMLNTETEKRKRYVLGSRNLNNQAKLMITQPSQYSFITEGGLGCATSGELTQVASSPQSLKLAGGIVAGKLSLPPLLSP